MREFSSPYLTYPQILCWIKLSDFAVVEKVGILYPFSLVNAAEICGLPVDRFEAPFPQEHQTFCNVAGRSNIEAYGIKSSEKEPAAIPAHHWYGMRIKNRFIGPIDSERRFGCELVVAGDIRGINEVSYRRVYASSDQVLDVWPYTGPGAWPPVSEQALYDWMDNWVRVKKEEGKTPSERNTIPAAVAFFDGQKKKAPRERIRKALDVACEEYGIERPNKKAEP